MWDNRTTVSMEKDTQKEVEWSCTKDSEMTELSVIGLFVLSNRHRRIRKNIESSSFFFYTLKTSLFLTWIILFLSLFMETSSIKRNQNILFEYSRLRGYQPLSYATIEGSLVTSNDNTFFEYCTFEPQISPQCSLPSCEALVEEEESTGEALLMHWRSFITSTINFILACGRYSLPFPFSFPSPILVAEAVSVNYHGTVYRGVEPQHIEEGSRTFVVDVSVPVFAADDINATRHVLICVLTHHLQLWDTEGKSLLCDTHGECDGEDDKRAISELPLKALDDFTSENHTSHSISSLSLPSSPQDRLEERGRGYYHGSPSFQVLHSWKETVYKMVTESRNISVSWDRQTVSIHFAPVPLDNFPHNATLVVIPCFPLSLFEQLEAVGIGSLKHQCLEGAPFVIRWAPFPRVPVQELGFLVTGKMIAVPVESEDWPTANPSTAVSREMMERSLRVVLGTTCSRTRDAFARGNMWDISTNTYRFTPYRGGVHSLCFIPFPDHIPQLLLKLLPSFLIAGPEGVSTDPPLVRAEVEFTATIFGTNLSSRDTAVMTEELCSQFNPHQPTVHVLDLLFISSSRIVFESIFHKRGIFHVCYHRFLSPAYVRVSTMLVEMGKEMVVESHNANILIDQDVKLLTSASVKKLKVQNKGNLVLNQTLNVASFFVWSGGSITGPGLLNNTGYGRVTTEGYETRVLSVPLYNYGELVFDAERVVIEREGCIHNYGNLTFTVDSMSSEGISSITSITERNIIYNYPGSILRIIALQEDAVALLMARIVAIGGSVILSGKLSLFTMSTQADAMIVVKKNSVASLSQGKIQGMLEVEEKASVTASKDTSLVGLTVFGKGTLLANGNGVSIDGIHVTGKMMVVIRTPPGQLTEASMSLSNVIVFDKETYLIVEAVKFFIAGPNAWLFIHGVLAADLDHLSCSGIFDVEVFSTALFFRSTYRLPLSLESADRYLRDVVIHSGAVAYMVDYGAPFVDRAPLDEGGEASTSCFSYFSIINLTLHGQLLLWGCAHMASAAQVNGSIMTLREKSDWGMLEMIYCRENAEVATTMKGICESLKQLQHLPGHSSLLSRGETVLWSPATVDVNDLMITRGFFAVRDELTLLARHKIVVRTSRLTLEKGGVLRTPSLLIGGLLELFAPLRSKVDGSVTVFKEAFVRIRGVRYPCDNFFSVSGSVTVEVPGDDIFHCVEANAGESDVSRALVSGLPPEVPCSPQIIEYVKENYMFFLFQRSSLTFHFEYSELPWPVLLGSSVFVLSMAIVILRLMLCFHGHSIQEWIASIKTPSPLQLTLSWNELNMNPFNYLGIAFFLIRVAQDFFCVLHPFLPLPLPYMRLLALRNAGMLFPHVLSQPLLPLWLSIGIIAWCLLLYACQALATKGPARLFYVMMVANQVEKVLMFFAVFFIFFSTQLLSVIGDGVMCSTILKDEPSCGAFRKHNASYLALEFAALFFYFVGTTQLYARRYVGKISHDFLPRISFHVAINLIAFLQVSFWKIFSYYPLAHVFVSLFFTVLQVTIAKFLPRTPFVNVNALYLCSAAIRIPMLFLILYYQVSLHLGWISSCEELSKLFLVLIAVSLVAFVGFFLFYLVYVRLPEGTVGDPSIDALRRSITQIQIRIQEIKSLLPSLTDPIEIENTQNAISRLRVEFLEKHDRYDWEVRRLLHPFYFMHPMEEPKSVGTPVGNQQTLDFLKLNSPTSGNASFLTDSQMENFCCGPVLGKGSYGTVYMGILPSGKLVAVKYINLASIREEVLNSVKGEVQMLMELSHPNIISYYGAHYTEGTLMIFMEFAVGGSLTSLVRKFSIFSEPVLQLYTVQILSGLLYLHHKGVIHRDIKGENILVDVDGISKLADFGSSKSLVSSNHSSVGTLVGSPFWMAPEVIRNEAYGIKADIWSVGCTVVEMLNGGEPPWKSQFDNAYSAMFYVGSTTDIPEIPEDTSELCRNFLHRCFQRDPSKRASADELLQHEWLASVPYRQGVRRNGGCSLLDFPSKAVLSDTLDTYQGMTLSQGPMTGMYDSSVHSSKIIQRLKSTGAIGSSESGAFGSSDRGFSSGQSALSRQTSNLFQNFASSSKVLERQSSEKLTAVLNLCTTPTTASQKSFDELAKPEEQKKTD